MSESNSSAAIRLRGVRHNNLKNFDLDLPLRRLIVVTGLSGSGKSSLAFDTLYAEGQRRYIETFSPYARQFFDRMDKPQVDSVEGIPPAIAIEQRNSVRTTRSTVGTMTEICDHMKVLWPLLAQLHCRRCGQPVRREPPQRVWDAIHSSPSSKAMQSKIEDENEGRGQRREVLITFDLPLSDKLSLEDSLALVAKQGYQRLLLNGETVRLDEAGLLLQHPGSSPQRLTVVQDRLKLAPAARPRFIEACEQAYHFGKGKLAIRLQNPPDHTTTPGLTVQPFNGSTLTFSNRAHCAHCDIEYADPSPSLFSFNHPLGACPTCKGFGRTITIDYALALPDRSLTLAKGAVKPWRTGTGAECQRDLVKFCKLRRVPMNVPFKRLSQEHQQWVIDGDKDYGIDDDHRWPRLWYGVKGYFRWLETKSYKMHVRVLLSRYRTYTKCPECDGQRFNKDAQLYLLPVATDVSPRTSRLDEIAPTDVGGYERLTLADFYALTAGSALELIEGLAKSHSTLHVSRKHSNDPMSHALNEVRCRLAYLNDVGLGYLTLDRPTRTLSGGETERVNLTTCLGTRLVNTLFVLDEPSVGLHPRDTDRLVHILERLRDTGNTVVVVEHEARVMQAADQIVDLGPGHGATGGEVVFQGSLCELLKSPRSLTGQYLSGRKHIELPTRRPVALECDDLSLISSAGRLVGLTAMREASRGGRAIQVFEGDKSPHSRKTRVLTLHAAAANNLKHLTLDFPLGRLVLITGVSGSGKSTLIRDVLLPCVAEKLEHKARTIKASDRPDSGEGSSSVENNSALHTPHAAWISGHESLAHVVLVDQSTLGKTPRSNPAVYIGAFDDIREVFAQSPAARQRGLNASAFSFNSVAGQCERCRGAGFEKIEMQFLSDVFIRCPDCNGRRYRSHILKVKVEGRMSRVESQTPRAKPSTLDARPSPVSWSIADMLEATVDEAMEFLSSLGEAKPSHRAVASLGLLQEVGLGYLRLGQPINTLSGGESQRLKLVRYLAEATVEGEHQDRATAAVSPASTPGPPSTLFLFDEPTTGLHFDDVRVLLQVFQRLVNAGHSVIVIEHNLDVIKCADWVIDLGPEAGDKGGQIVAQGTPENVARCTASHTGRFLRNLVGTRSTAFQTSRRKIGDGLEHVPTDANAIAITGAREHNLKNLSLTIPRDQFVVITGVSGSGKSTLAFDLLFAEGQRRFLDSMSLYARQFVEQMSRPDVDSITGIPPTVSIEQRTTRGGGKSTVATVTEVHHFLRLLFARLGTQFCPDCQVAVEPQTRDELERALHKERDRRGDLRLLSPVVKNRKGYHSDIADWAAKQGYMQLRADSRLYDTSKPFRLDRFREHDVEIVVGLLSPRNAVNRGPTGLIEESLKLGHGTLFALDESGQLTVHSTERVCPSCNRSFEPLDPKNFSYNSSQGWCPRCRGFGELFYLPDVERGANADSIEESWWSWANERESCPECHGARLNPVARAVRFNARTSSRLSSTSISKAVGDRCAEGPTIDYFSRLPVETAFEFFRGLKLTGRDGLIARDIIPEMRERLKFLKAVGLGYLQLGRGVPTLSGGEGQRIRLAAQLGSNLSGVLYVLDEPTIGLHPRDNQQLLAALEKLKARGNSVVVVEHDEDTMRRADHIIDLGPGAGVHGGEVVAAGTLAELAKHPESVTGRCLRAKKVFPSRGVRRTLDLKCGELPPPSSSSRLVGQTAAHGASRARRAIQNVDGDKSLQFKVARVLTLHDAATNNLKHLTVSFPLGRLVLVTGVSGSGKSTLVRDCLLPAVQSVLKVGQTSSRANFKKTHGVSRGLSPRLTGFESLRAVYEVDQSPIGRTPRSIPATYVGFFDDIRALFAQIPEARMRGYSASRFSFNSAQGRCPECEGAGQIKLEMNFLPPAFVRCETCGGTRFDRETLDIEYSGKNIAQVLNLSVEEALEFFGSFSRIRRALQALHDTGLDYLKLGQQSPTLSGGEAQRVKLVAHLLTGLAVDRKEPHTVQNAAEKIGGAAECLATRLRGDGRRNLFILEEPTIGLHMADVRRLVEVLQRLVDAGHTVIVIEHNLDLIAEADWVIDLGPEGGEGGGRIVCEGTPEEVARNKHSHTGRFLRRLLQVS